MQSTSKSLPTDPQQLRQTVLSLQAELTAIDDRINYLLERFRLAQEANPRLVRYINDYGVLTRPNPRHQDFF